jgi:hypothetical protein
MKSLTEQPAVLSVHAGPAGQYILRVANIRYRPLVVGVTKLLPDASSFVLITPTDIKVFAVGGSDNGTSMASSDNHGAMDNRDNSGELSTEAPLDAETLAAIAAEEGRTVPGESPDGPPTQEVVGEAPQGAKVVKRKRPAQVAGHDETCGRCQGAGRVQMMLDGGKGAEAPCPICKGVGVMRRYGARR